MRILLVDDSTTIIYIMSKMLKELGYKEIDTAQDPEEAKEKIDINIPDLIISDWNMPKGTGFDLLKFIRTNRETAKLPFMMLTSDHDKSKIIKAKEYNPQFCLLKPTTKAQLAERLFSLAKTHGIQPPPEYSRPSKKTADGDFAADDTTAKGASEEKSLHVALTNEHVTKIIKKLLLVFNKKADPDSVRTWIAKEIFSTDPEQVAYDDVDGIVDVLSTALRDTLHSIYNDKK